MNLSRIFTNAIARRVAYVVVAAVIGWLASTTDASACTKTSDRAWSNCADAGQAAMVVSSAMWSPIANCNVRNERLEDNGTSVSKFATYGGDGVTAVCGYLYPNHTGVGTAGYLKSCDSRPDQTGRGPWSTLATARSGTVQCNSGCETMWMKNADGTMTGSTETSGKICQNNKDMCDRWASQGYYWNGFLQACELPEVECPAGQEKTATGECKEEQCPAGMVVTALGTCENKKNECPAGNVKAPSGECLPGDGQCAQGEAKGKDGTCKRDSNGDGTPDSEEGQDDPDKDSASGGDSCNSPPSCNGNPIMCAQLRTQWRIDCNTRKNRNVTGGHCGAGGVPVCTGDKCDAVEYGQLVQTWKAACAMEKIAGQGNGSGSGSGNGDGNGNGQPDWTEVDGDGSEGAGADPEKPHRKVSLGTDRLDDGGFLGGSRSCPQFPVVDLGMFGTWDPNELGYFCEFVTLVRWTLVLLGAFIAFRIMAGS